MPGVGGFAGVESFPNEMVVSVAFNEEEEADGLVHKAKF